MSWDDTLLAVVAHGLLSSMGLVTASLRGLNAGWPEFEPSEREALLRNAEEHALYVGAVLADLVRGLPVGVVHELEHLRD